MKAERDQFPVIKMIIDTNIFIDIFRGKSETLDYIENLNENIATTIINKYELLRGNNKIKNIFESIIHNSNNYLYN
jgi:predicted nucleic acid-binding protein